MVKKVVCHQVEDSTPREVERAKRAKKLYYDLDAPAIDNLKVWIRSNQARNVPVSVDDVKLLQRMEHNDIPTIKGKWVKPHPPIVKKEDFVDMPPELEVTGMIVDLAIDVVYINDCSFFIQLIGKLN